MSTDPADVLRSLAEDLKADAAEVDPDTPVESGLVEGLGRAAGRAQAKAEQIESGEHR